MALRSRRRRRVSTTNDTAQNRNLSQPKAKKRRIESRWRCTAQTKKGRRCKLSCPSDRVHCHVHHVQSDSAAHAAADRSRLLFCRHPTQKGTLCRNRVAIANKSCWMHTVVPVSWRSVECLRSLLLRIDALIAEYGVGAIKQCACMKHNEPTAKELLSTASWCGLRRRGSERCHHVVVMSNSDAYADPQMYPQRRLVRDVYVDSVANQKYMFDPTTDEAFCAQCRYSHDGWVMSAKNNSGTSPNGAWDIFVQGSSKQLKAENNMTQLKAKLRRRGLRVGGNKDELVKRLVADDIEKRAAQENVPAIEDHIEEECVQQSVVLLTEPRNTDISQVNEVGAGVDVEQRRPPPLLEMPNAKRRKKNC